MSDNLSWREAAIAVLKTSAEAMHYTEIAEAVAENRLRGEFGATPAQTVNATISMSIKTEGDASPFLRTEAGRYRLRDGAALPIAEPEEPVETGLIHAFGMFWGREDVAWEKRSRLLGRQPRSSTDVDFYGQEGGRMIIFENADPFAVARRVLGELQDPPYGLIGYGGGRGIVSALGHLVSIEPAITSIHYVGDLDYAGLEIAKGARARAKELGLPALAPATELHRQMLQAARAFGHPQGWPRHAPRSEREECLEALSADLRDQVGDILRAGNRVPEEVLGPDELRDAWTAAC